MLTATVQIQIRNGDKNYLRIFAGKPHTLKAGENLDALTRSFNEAVAQAIESEKLKESEAAHHD